MLRRGCKTNCKRRNSVLGIMAKKAFVLRIEEETLKAVEKWAADEFRSTNGHLEWLIDKALRDAGRKKGGAKAKDKNGSENEQKE